MIRRHPSRCLVAVLFVPALIVLLLLSAQSPAAAQGLKEGYRAPRIDADTWLNLGDKTSPDLRNKKAIMVLFWRTDSQGCKPWLAFAQKFTVRYSDFPFTIVSFSDESPEVLQAFIKEQGITFPVGVDADQRAIKTFKVEEYPTTYLVAGGKIVYSGRLAGVEVVVESLLGFKPRDLHTLTNYLNLLQAQKYDEAQEILRGVTGKNLLEHKVRTWATLVGGEGEAKKDEILPDMTTKLLSEVTTAWVSGDRLKLKEGLDKLATEGPKTFNLTAWKQAEFAERFPMSKATFSGLLKAGSRRSMDYVKALEALLERNPSESVLTIAKRNGGLRKFCKQRGGEFFAVNGRRGLMRLHWVIPRKPIPENKQNEFNRELGGGRGGRGRGRTGPGGQPLSGQERNTGTGVTDPQRVSEASLPGYVRKQFALAQLAESIISGKVKKLDIKKIWEQAEQREKGELVDLENKYK